VIEYVVSENPDDRIIQKASQLLKTGKLICLPVETNWIVIADPFEKQGVDSLYRFRHVDNTKHFTVFCSDFKSAGEIAHIEDHVFRLLKRVVPGPYTFIFKAQKKIIRHLKASKIDHEVGVRFPDSNLLKKLLDNHGGVVIGTHVTVDMIADHLPDAPIWSGLIEEEFGHHISMVLDTGELEFTGPTTIISFSEGVAEVVREGSGDLSPFGL
jgi:tRNA threonylcarbamoyl adenosine modification protein (Sua5/YciO/YrdC/YwlC family)